MGCVTSKQQSRKKKDLSRLPDEILLEIFRILSFREQVRVRRVNKRFRLISDWVISETKIINFREENCPFGRINAEWFRKLIGLCYKNLEKITFSANNQVLIEAFSQLACPRLKLIEIDDNISNEIFGHLFINNENLRYFWWNNRNAGELIEFPDGTHACETLDSLGMSFNDVSLNSFVGRCPMLDYLFIRCEPTPVTFKILDKLFVRSPEITSFGLYYLDYAGVKLPIDLNGFVSFWKLPLVDLSISCPVVTGTDDEVLRKTVTAFPLLESIWFLRLEPTIAGVRALMALPHLKSVCLGSEGIGIDYGVRDLANRGRLEQISIRYVEIRRATFLALLRYCEKLRRVSIKGINAVNTPNEAAAIIGSIFAKQFKINVIISLDPLEIWKSDEANAALKALEEKDGHIVQFEE